LGKNGLDKGGERFVGSESKRMAVGWKLQRSGQVRVLCQEKKDEDLFDSYCIRQVKLYCFYCWNSLAGQYLT